QAQGEAVVIARLDRTRIGEVRGMLPALAHRVL
ncbi:MAG: carbon-nitrogen hydrolase family protein, partial [Betaproteobacteria bacterium]|nr:carbon-nitrogen hydrolase family protein [Betaproteobacteria bacterium]